jgi:hypothetical protein
MPPGLNTGYSYLFKAFGKNPVEGGDFLYILDFKDPTKFDIAKYASTYPGKHLSLDTFGFVNLVSVK